MLASYIKGLAEKGYRFSFIEDMSFRHQERFDANIEPYDEEREVIKELQVI